MKLVVVLPTYNEAENLPIMAETLLTLAIPDTDIHVIVVDDNSPDGTGELADAIAAAYPTRVQVVHRPGKMGLGRAYVDGFRRALASGADVILQMDSDFSHNPKYIPIMVAALRDADIVVGSRYVPGGAVDRNWPLWRKAISRWGSVYSRAILGLRVHDATAGFKLFRRQALEALPIESTRSNGYAFQIEVAYLSQRARYRVVEIPILFDDRTRGSSKMSPMIALEASWRVWQIKRRYS
ncbi:MAG: polyprenol monophosphomannose synthase [Dehalococcoidia bacterium]|nr:polyprenol monophosphomannose synthase [Dehalococcoidia bacterium]